MPSIASDVPARWRVAPLLRATEAPQTWGYPEVGAALARHAGLETEGGAALSVLEAGGGSASHLALPAGAHVTTIDISADALALNSYAHETIEGDLQTFDYGDRRYDLVICWDVLEHLADPQAALARFADILKPGGKLVLVGPVPTTVKGWFTRLTPHWVHVAFYRRILGSRTAGLPGHPPFATHLSPAAEPRRVARFLAARGLDISALQAFESHHVAALGARSPLLLGAYRLAERVLSAVSRGRIDRGITDFFMIAVKPGAASATRSTR